jgi:hypothetical protein
MRQFVQTEVKNNKGKADSVVKTAESIYIFEFKMDDNATAEDALKQIILYAGYFYAFPVRGILSIEKRISLILIPR